MPWNGGAARWQAGRGGCPAAVRGVNTAVRPSLEVPCRFRARAAIVLFLALAGIYVISHFYRASNAVIAPDLMRELSLSAEAMGTLTSSFFFAFAAAQIPLGMLLDRFGTRVTVPSMMAFAVIGSLLFAVASDMAGLTAGRILMGLGCASVYIGALVVCSRWFPPHNFTIFSGLLVAAGNGGNLLATKPLAEAAAAFGWRGTFVGMAAIATVAAVVCFVIVRDAPPGHAFHHRTPEKLRTILAGVGEVATNPLLPPLLIMQFFGYASTMVILGLWGGPYLADVHGLALEDRGSVLLLMSLGLIAGSVVFGFVERLLDTRKWLTFGGGVLAAGTLFALAALEQPPLWLVASLFSACAFLNAYNITGLTHAKTIFPERLVGRGMMMMALGTMGGVAVMQFVTGLILGAFADGAVVPEAGYRTMFGVVAATVFFSLFAYLRVPDRKPSSERPAPAG